MLRNPQKKLSQEKRVLLFLLTNHEATRREIADQLGILENSVAQRLRDLAKDGAVEKSGPREYQGCVCERWVLTDAGRTMAAKVYEGREG